MMLLDAVSPIIHKREFITKQNGGGGRQRNIMEDNGGGGRQRNIMEDNGGGGRQGNITEDNGGGVSAWGVFYRLSVKN